jgi:23S rRNA (adenine2503-C2)-methyltransferase
MIAPTSLIGSSAAELTTLLTATGLEPKPARMRARQLWNWTYVHGARDFASMTNLAKDFRNQMAERFTLARPEIVTQQISEDGTRKFLLRTGPGIEFETVYIPEEDRGTLCVSSQVGCTLNCRFCHTGTQKLVRNLTPYEIVGQLMVARDALGDWPSTGARPGKVDAGLPSGRATDKNPSNRHRNVVMMGMGEPLHNFEHVKSALAIVAMATASRSPNDASHFRRRALSR